MVQRLGAEIDESQVGKSSCGAVVQPHWGHIGASDPEALGGGAGEGEGPYRMVGCVTARVAWADPWALATGVVREG